MIFSSKSFTSCFKTGSSLSIIVCSSLLTVRFADSELTMMLKVKLQGLIASSQNIGPLDGLKTGVTVKGLSIAPSAGDFATP